MRNKTYLAIIQGGVWEVGNNFWIDHLGKHIAVGTIVSTDSDFKLVLKRGNEILKDNRK